MKAVVTGMIANYGVGGVAWDYGQYALALERLGFEVYYLEDTGTPVYDPVRGEYGDDCTFAVRFLEQSLSRLSPALRRRWRFVNGDGRAFGLDEATFREVLEHAELFLNVSNSALVRDDYLRCRRRVLVDTDPGLNHFHNYPRWDASPGWLGTHGWRSHHTYFTYAGRLGRPDCPLPDFGMKWIPTRPPVVVDAWIQAESPGPAWTTVMTWKNFPKLIQHGGRSYGAKEFEFPKIESLPRRFDALAFEVAVGGNEAPRDRWRNLGWTVLDAPAVTSDTENYRDYVVRSRGELSVAKNIYVATRCGWFSCRTVCYLAAGRPAVVQDTGFSELHPCGEGLLAFDTTAQAAAALETVERDYARHAGAARELARTCFDSDLVLREMLEVIDCPLPP
jgi:hypothetical protein